MNGNIFIAGLGLIGGSLALSIKKQHSGAVIYGYDVNQSETEKAMTLGLIDKKAESISLGAEIADLIILATPVMETKKLLKALSAAQLKKNVIITDTGSTKGEIMPLAELLLKGKATFIGGHPMAGSHKTGAANASAHLFENAFYVLTPSESVMPKESELLKQWLEGTKAHFLEIDGEEHDQLTAVISHFPHIIAAALVTQAKKSAEKNPLVSMLAAGGFRDITRIASSNPRMWKDIVKQNRSNILDLLDDWVEELQGTRSLIYEGDENELLGFFEEAKTYRDSLPIRTQGAIPSYYDLHVDMEDTTGAIARIAATLAAHQISIANLQIIESREGLPGVLRISFKKEDDRSLAEQLLQENKYQTFDMA